jgi:hypothetical protein
MEVYMYYVYDTIENMLHGPFTNRDRAEAWAENSMAVGAYAIVTDKYAQTYHIHTKLSLVPKEYR